MEFNEIVDSLSNAVSSYMLTEIDEDGFAKRVSDCLIRLSAERYLDENAIAGGKEFEVHVIPTANFGHGTVDSPYGVRVFPNKGDARFISQELVRALQDRCSGDKICDYWLNQCNHWVVEIEARMIQDISQFNPDEIAMLIMYDILHVVYSADIPELLWNSYIRTYFRVDMYTRNVMNAANLLLIIPVVNACTFKNWLEIKKIRKSSSELPKVVSECDEKHLVAYNDIIESAISKLVRIYGTSVIMSNEERARRIESDMRWVQINVNDWVHAKNLLKDEIILRAMRTGSPYLREFYIDLIGEIGGELRRRTDGFLIESWTPDFFDDPMLLQKCQVYFNPSNKKGIAFEGMIASLIRKNELAQEGFFDKRPPKLPAEKEIDMCFIKVDQMTCQSDRKWVIDQIDRLERDISEFEEYYASDHSVMGKYKGVIERQRHRLDLARDEVLAKRSFKTQYRVFVEVPDGYEG